MRAHKYNARRTTMKPANLLAWQCVMAGVSEPQREYKFHGMRRWRFDLAWPGQKLAVEVDGGVWIAGRHTRGAGFEADCVKGAAALILGWRVLHVTPGQITKGFALAWIEQALAIREV
jgi:very-short-patch-repair endonuclease